MKHIKVSLIILSFLISLNGFSQALPTTLYLNTGDCILSDSLDNGYEITNTVVLTNPTLGSINVVPQTGSFVYCSNGIAGEDTIQIYACLSNNIITFPICDTFSIVFVIIDDSTSNSGCQAYFYNYIDSVNPNTFQFLDYSVYSPVSWSWDFGDSTISNLQNPLHTYANQGNWNVCLTIVDSIGCTSTFCKSLSNIPVQDVQAYLFHQSTVTPGFPLIVALNYYNAGTILMNGNISYRYPMGTTFNSTSLVPLSHDVVNRLLTFNYNNLLPGSSGNIQVDLDVSASLLLGSLANDTLWLNPIMGDVTPINNVSTIEDVVVGSWDPNDKAVSPKGIGENGNVPLNTNELSYKIRFQNTGTAPARNVIIRDIISDNIDLASLTVTDASHLHTTEISGNELVVTFQNINLPDSGANFIASQGYINIHALLKPALPNGSIIYNTAEIYFDFNAPVITNTVITTLSNTFTSIDATPTFVYNLFPNPASSSISLHGTFEKHAYYEIYNALGKVVLIGEIKSDNVSINLSNFNAGFYSIKIYNSNSTDCKKIMLLK